MGGVGSQGWCLGHLVGKADALPAIAGENGEEELQPVVLQILKSFPKGGRNQVGEKKRGKVIRKHCQKGKQTG